MSILSSFHPENPDSDSYSANPDSDIVRIILSLVCNKIKVITKNSYLIIIQGNCIKTCYHAFHILMRNMLQTTALYALARYSKHEKNLQPGLMRHFLYLAPPDLL